MNIEIIIERLKIVPWVALAWMGATVLIAFMVWQFTLIHDNKDWLRWASERVRDEVAELRRQLVKAEREN